MKNKIKYGLIIVTVILISGCAQKSTPKEDLCKVKSLEKIGEGCFPKWSPDGSLIAYTKEIDNNDYQIYTMKPDGSDVKCLTCNKAGLANTRWRGQPYWHPSGEYIVFTAETAKYPRKGAGVATRPGLGRNHNVWIMTSDGSKFWQITDYPDNWGVIRPSFSHDGKTLLWNEEFMMEKYPHGKPGVDKHPGCWWGSESQIYRKGEELCAWRIKLANISFESKEPEISNIRHIDPPDGFTVIEIAGFMPNDIGFIYSYCDIKKQGGRCVWGDIYTSDLSGSISSFRQLTDSFHVHDESPEFSPDGKKIIWATSAGGDPGEGEEVWLMDAEGSNKVRLTYFTDPNHSEYDPIGRQITEMTWSPDGKNVVFGHVSDEKRGSPHIPSDLYKLTFEGGCGNQIQPICGNGICEEGETEENCPEDCEKTFKVKSITTIKENAGRVDWSHSGNNLITFDKEDDDGYFDVYIMNPDGSGEQCLTCGKSELPKHHIGQPAWHPSGKYIVFQAVDPELEIYPPAQRAIGAIVTNPGGGVNNNLWLMNSEATKFWQLTNVGEGLGVLHPHFSKDGSMLTWAEKISWKGYKWGQWVIKIADFNVSSTDPKISNIRICQPENLRFYETHGFSPDGTKLIFSGLEQDEGDEGMDIYIMDISSGDCSKAQILTDDSIDQWDEHSPISPDGSKIVWMSSMDIDQGVEQFKFKADFWSMNTDGSNKQRLTYFNDPSASEYIPGGVAVSDSSWNRDGNKLVVFLIDRSGKDEHSIVMIEFENGDEKPVCGNGICEPGETEDNCPEDCEKEYKVKSITTIKEHGGRVSWSYTRDLIAFDRIGLDGYTDIYLMQPDGANVQCLTCTREEVPQLNNGNPEWHPTGDYIIFQAQNPDLDLPSGMSESIFRYIASPGVGINNDLWVMTADGSQFWQLTEVEDLYGTLHPHFSPDGSQLVWSEMISPLSDRIGHWTIKLADFEVVNGIPRLTNIKTMRPNSLQLYETHEFSPDGQYIIFSGVPEGEFYYDMENYLLDLETGQTIQLTNNDEWDEQAHFVNEGRQIIWVSSEGNSQPRPSSFAGVIENPPLLDYWIMGKDGSNKQRLTGFNDPESRDHISIEYGIGLGDFDLSPDGKTIIGKMRRGRQDTIVMIKFE